MTDANRTAVAVTLLADDEQARRLVISWPLVPRELEGRRVLVEWSKVSGVPISAVERLSVPLARHQICNPDRTVDPEALRVIAHVAADSLRSGRSRR